MNLNVIKSLISEKTVSVGDLAKSKAASNYTIYKTIEELKWLGLASVKGAEITFLETPLSVIFKKLFFEGFDIEVLSRKNVEFLLVFLEPKKIEEAAKELDKSVPQTNRQAGKLMQFLGKAGKKYFVSNSLLREFLIFVKQRNLSAFYWSNKDERLLKVPLDFDEPGVLTGFSRFSEFGLEVNTSFKYLFQPKKELGLEEIMCHAIKFSANANELLLCILFYLKKKHKMSAFSIEKQCEKLGVRKLWFDIVSYMEDQPVRETKMFLPKAEFRQKAVLYGLKPIARFGDNEIQKLFSQVENKLAEKTVLFLIGGNALIEHKAKNSTKDIDLVALTEKDAKNAIRAFQESGYTELHKKELQYENLEASIMLEKENFPRIDLFIKKICNALEFSKEMEKRSRIIREGKLEMRLACLEDIFLLKSISSRDSDIIDCENILRKSRLDWEIIYTEIMRQEKNLFGLKELTILEHFEALEQMLDIKIPITKKIMDLCLEKGILFLAKKPVTVEEISGKINFPQSTIRNKITRLVKAGKLVKIKGKPFKVQAKAQ